MTIAGEPVASVATQSGFRVVKLAGDLDLFSADVLRRELDEALPDGSELVVVDLGDVTFLDSTVLGLLLLASRRMGSQGGELVLAAPGAAVERVLDVAGLSTYLPTYESVGEAQVRHGL